MKKTARHHHYLSQCYLRSFTKSGEKKPKLTVIDLSKKKKFETSTRNVGGIRDFNRIEIAGVEPDAVEKVISTFESNAASSLRNIESTLTFDGDDKNNILNLIALLSVRSPEQRENWRQFHANIAEKLMDLSLATKERWESQVSQMKAAGRQLNDVTYEDMVDFHERKAYNVSLTTEYHLYAEFTGLSVVLPLLFERKWLLISATKDTGPFVTTDHPVLLAWNNPEEIPPFYRNSPGHGMRKTQILFPISRNLSLVGEFNGKEGTITGTRDLVAILNTRMMMSAFQYIYAPKISFSYTGQYGEILDGTSILNNLKS